MFVYDYGNLEIKDFIHKAIGNFSEITIFIMQWRVEDFFQEGTRGAQVHFTSPPPNFKDNKL